MRCVRLNTDWLLLREKIEGVHLRTISQVFVVENVCTYRYRRYTMKNACAKFSSRNEAFASGWLSTQ